jgi:hypothetical protein
MADTEIIHLSDDEKRELIAALKRAIDGDRHFLSARVRVLKSILGRLEPPKPAPPPLRPVQYFAPPRTRQTKLARQLFGVLRNTDVHDAV